MFKRLQKIYHDFPRIFWVVVSVSFIDRIGGTLLFPFFSLYITEKFGVSPSVKTWGDYFQTEMATSLIVLSDEEFSKAVDTVKFDMIAGWLIFSNQDSTFFEWVNTTHLEIIKSKIKDYTPEEEEIRHLKILMDYYNDLGIVDNFTEAEKEWYSGFNEAMAI